MSEAWDGLTYDKRDGATVRACMAGAVGEVIGKDIVALEQRCAALEAELAAMRVGGTRPGRLRAVPASAPAAMIA